MPDEPASADEASPDRPEADLPPRRRPSVDEVFGDVLPDTTGDERDSSRRAGSDREEGASRDEDLLRDVPPHHGS